MTSVRLTPKMLDLLTYAAECGQATCYVGSDYWRTARALLHLYDAVGSRSDRDGKGSRQGDTRALCPMSRVPVTMHLYVEDHIWRNSERWRLLLHSLEIARWRRLRRGAG